MIPLAILHRNEFENLLKMLEALEKNTTKEIKIFVIDNKSDQNELNKYRSKIEKYSITLIESQKNNWVLGFNLAINHPKWPKDSEYYIFSDSDIIVPPPDENGCWLSKMLAIMDQNCSIGKLGISLRVDDIDNIDLKKSVISQKNKFDKHPRIQECIVAPVDTTLAIYRPDFFMSNKFKFNIGHASLARPYYYTCRTPSTITAKHLGWYEETRIKIDDKKLSEKIKCFAKYGAFIDKEIYQKARIGDRLFYKLIKPLSTFYWGILVLLKISTYLIKNFPRNINIIQNKCR